MKNNTKLIMLASALVAVSLVSIRSMSHEAYAHNEGNSIDKASVHQFVRKNILLKMDDLKDGPKMKMISRCPSGFTHRMADNQLNADQFIYGKVLEWEGCTTKDFCEYKINMDKNIALLRDKQLKKFQPVAAYVKAKKKILKL